MPQPQYLRNLTLDCTGHILIVGKFSEIYDDYHKQDYSSYKLNKELLNGGTWYVFPGVLGISPQFSHLRFDAAGHVRHVLLLHRYEADDYPNPPVDTYYRWYNLARVETGEAEIKNPTNRVQELRIDCTGHTREVCNESGWYDLNGEEVAA